MPQICVTYFLADSRSGVRYVHFFLLLGRTYLLLRTQATTKKLRNSKHCLISQGVVLLSMNAVHITVQGHPKLMPKLEGSIKEVWCFEATLFVDLKPFHVVGMIFSDVILG